MLGHRAQEPESVQPEEEWVRMKNSAGEERGSRDSDPGGREE